MELLRRLNLVESCACQPTILLCLNQVVTIGKNVIQKAKMSKDSCANRLKAADSRRLPWDAILKKMNAETLHQLEERIGVSSGTLSRASQPSAKDPRGLSKKACHKLLLALSQQFGTSGDFKSWVSRHWPEDIYEISRECVDRVAADMDYRVWLPAQIRRLPSYVSRAGEEALIEEYIVGEMSKGGEFKGVFVSGIGGIGKTTLVANALYGLRELLYRHYALVIWVDGALSPNWLDAITLQVQTHLSASGSRFSAKAEVARYCSHNKVLVVVDTLHDIPDLNELLQFVGAMGRVIVIAREKPGINPGAGYLYCIICIWAD